MTTTRRIGVTQPDLDALAALIDDAYHDGPGEVVPWVLLEGLDRLIGADFTQVTDLDVRNRTLVEQQAIIDGDERFVDDGSVDVGDSDMYFECTGGFVPCWYPMNHHDLRSVTRWSDFYSDREVITHQAYVDYFDPVRYALAACLPTGQGRMRRVIFMRSDGPDFSVRDVTLLSLLRPHLIEIDADAARRRQDAPRLTNREWEVLELAAVGLSNADIAARLFLSSGTVRKHMEHIFEQLGVHNRAAAVALAMPFRPAVTVAR